MPGKGTCGLELSVLQQPWVRTMAGRASLTGPRLAGTSLALSDLFVLSLPVITVFTNHPTLPIKNDRDDGVQMNHFLSI